MATTQLTTTDDLFHLPDDGQQYELREGVLIRKSPTGWVHSQFELKLGAQLLHFADQHRLGAVFPGDAGFVLARNPDTVLVPDVSFVRQGRLPSLTEQQGFLPFAPDLAVEILSPSNRAGEIADKVRRYLAAGSSLVWVIDPLRHRATVYQSNQSPVELGEDGVLDGGDVLPGFRVALSELWPS